MFDIEHHIAGSYSMEQNLIVQKRRLVCVLWLTDSQYATWCLTADIFFSPSAWTRCGKHWIAPPSITFAVWRMRLRTYVLRWHLTEICVTYVTTCNAIELVIIGGPMRYEDFTVMKMSLAVVRRCYAEMEAVTVMPSCSRGGNVVVAWSQSL